MIPIEKQFVGRRNGTEHQYVPGKVASCDRVEYVLECLETARSIREDTERSLHNFKQVAQAYKYFLHVLMSGVWYTTCNYCVR